MRAYALVLTIAVSLCAAPAAFAQTTGGVDASTPTPAAPVVPAPVVNGGAAYGVPNPATTQVVDLPAATILPNGYAAAPAAAPQEVKDAAMAYLVVVLENRSDDRVEEDTAELAELVTELGALDLYVLPTHAGAALIEAREKAFWTAKAMNADDIIDMVVPRASIPQYLAAVQQAASDTGSLVVGCGHAGDGNVHLSVFQPDVPTRKDVVGRVLRAGADLGGAVSGEHGIGTEKKAYLAAIEDPAKLDLMRRISSP